VCFSHEEHVFAQEQCLFFAIFRIDERFQSKYVQKVQCTFLLNSNICKTLAKIINQSREKIIINLEKNQLEKYNILD